MQPFKDDLRKAFERRWIKRHSSVDLEARVSAMLEREKIGRRRPRWRISSVAAILAVVVGGSAAVAEGSILATRSWNRPSGQARVGPIVGPLLSPGGSTPGLGPLVDSAVAGERCGRQARPPLILVAAYTAKAREVTRWLTAPGEGGVSDTMVQNRAPDELIAVCYVDEPAGQAYPIPCPNPTTCFADRALMLIGADGAGLTPSAYGLRSRMLPTPPPPADARTFNDGLFGITFTYPGAWRSAHYDVVSSFTTNITYLSTQPMHAPCVDHPADGGGARSDCRWPIADVDTGGLLVTWQILVFPGKDLGQASGRPVTIGQTVGKLDERGPGSCGPLTVDASLTLTVPRPKAATNYYWVQACLRGPDLDLKRKEVVDMMGSLVTSGP